MKKTIEKQIVGAVGDFISFMQVLEGMESGDTQKFIANNHEFILIKLTKQT
jgi:hypothetical protein